MENNSDIQQKSSKDEIAKRLNEVFLYVKKNTEIVNQSLFAEKISEQRSNFSAALNGNEKYLTKGLLMKVIKAFPDINPIWLLTGKETMIKGEDDQQITTNDPVLAEDVISFHKGVPYYNIDFTNGFMGVVEFENINPDYYIDFPPANNCDYWINATGHSMENIINHGDAVAIKEVDLSWFPLGEIYAIVTSNGYRLIKRITKSRSPKCYCLVSENPDKDKYPDQDIPKDYIVRLFKVVRSMKIIN
nr:S24 family peptidase [uncultured Capnocytophaga sp.]